jgi:hypothetical protein
MNVTKASDSDYILTIVLNKCIFQLLAPLTKQFASSFIGEGAWFCKFAEVHSTSKPGVLSNPGNPRPISLQTFHTLLCGSSLIYFLVHVSRFPTVPSRQNCICLPDPAHRSKSDWLHSLVTRLQKKSG